MTNENPIDLILDQIEATDNIFCARCNERDNYLYQMSCDHYICLDCASLKISKNQYKTCPSCQNILAKNLSTLVEERDADVKLHMLSQNYNINIGDTLWIYSGNSGYWLYDNDCCNKLNQAYQDFLSFNDADDSANDADDSPNSYDEDPTTTELQINIGTRIDTYVIDFINGLQYQKNNPSKKRSLKCFKLNAALDIKTYNIVGIAGKKL